ncbi:MAG TPA: hypothetical protein V6C69_02760 [Trichormus sp.]
MDTTGCSGAAGAILLTTAAVRPGVVDESLESLLRLSKGWGLFVTLEATWRFAFACGNTRGGQATFRLADETTVACLLTDADGPPCRTEEAAARTCSVGDESGASFFTAAVAGWLVDIVAVPVTPFLIPARSTALTGLIRATLCTILLGSG